MYTVRSSGDFGLCVVCGDSLVFDGGETRPYVVPSDSIYYDSKWGVFTSRTKLAHVANATQQQIDSDVFHKFEVYDKAATCCNGYVYEKALRRSRAKPSFELDVDIHWSNCDVESVFDLLNLFNTHDAFEHLMHIDGIYGDAAPVVNVAHDRRLAADGTTNDGVCSM